MIPLSLRIGDNSMPVPIGVKAVTGMALIDLRKRRVPLRWLNAEDFAEIQRGRLEFRGMPSYYRVEQGVIRFWPCASHEWMVTLSVDDRLTQEKIDERYAHA